MGDADDDEPEIMMNNIVGSNLSVRLGDVVVDVKYGVHISTSLPWTTPWGTCLMLFVLKPYDLFLVRGAYSSKASLRQTTADYEREVRLDDVGGVLNSVFWLNI